MGLTSWDDTGFFVWLTDTLDPRLREAAEVIATRQRQLLSVDYPPASRSPDPPRRRTGELQSKVEVQKGGELLYFIGPNVNFGLALELGRLDGTLQPRKFLLRSLMETDQQVLEIIVGVGDFREGVLPFAASFAPGFAPR